MEHEAASDKVLKQRALAVVGYLSASPGTPVVGLTLGQHLSIKGNRENKRRKAREAVRHAREVLGHRICAGNDGYWLARSAGEWEDYQQSAKSGAVFTFIRLRRTERAVTERIGGQGKLFETRNTECFGA